MSWEINCELKVSQYSMCHIQTINCILLVGIPFMFPLPDAAYNELTFKGISSGDIGSLYECKGFGQQYCNAIVPGLLGSSVVLAVATLVSLFT